MATEPLILIVEDDRQASHLLKSILKSLHVDLIYAETAEDGVQLAHEQRPNLILMDLRFPSPGIKGWDAIEQIKADPLLQHIPILAVSAGGGECIGRAMQAGADEFIEKPFALNRMLKTVMHFLNIAQAG